MLQKILFNISFEKTKNIPNIKGKFSKSDNNYSLIQKILCYKYSKFEYSYQLFCTNNLIFNDKSRIVARFKDFLILYDSHEFLKKYFKKRELNLIQKKILKFYDDYCQIFPNYIILPENTYLYKNIRKKQKMIDAFNEIKNKEEENRQYLINKNKNEFLFFDNKIKESIEKYSPSISNILNSSEKDFTKFQLNLSSQNKSNIEEKEDNNKTSFSSGYTIYKIIKHLNNKKVIKKGHINDKYNNSLKIKSDNLTYAPKMVSKLKKKKILLSKNNELIPIESKDYQTETCKNLVKDDKTIKIIHNINNIIINGKSKSNLKNGMIININNNYIQLKQSKKNNKNSKNKLNNIFQDKNNNSYFYTNNNIHNKIGFFEKKIFSPKKIESKNRTIKSKSKSTNKNNTFYDKVTKKNQMNNEQKKIKNNFKHHTNKNLKNIKQIIHTKSKIIRDKIKKIQNKSKNKNQIKSIDNEKFSTHKKINNGNMTTSKKVKLFQKIFNREKAISLNILDKEKNIKKSLNNEKAKNRNNIRKLIHDPKNNSLQINNTIKKNKIKQVNSILGTESNINKKVNKIILNYNFQKSNQSPKLRDKYFIKMEINNAKERKRKYLDMIKNNKVIHNSFDNQNKIHLFQRYKNNGSNNIQKFCDFNYMTIGKNSINDNINNTCKQTLRVLLIKNRFKTHGKFGIIKNC